MADLVVAAVVCLGVNAVDVLHQAGKIASPCLDDQVVMVSHETVGQYHGVEPHHCLRDHSQEGIAIRVILEDGFASIST